MIYNFMSRFKDVLYLYFLYLHGYPLAEINDRSINYRFFSLHCTFFALNSIFPVCALFSLAFGADVIHARHV